MITPYTGTWGNAQALHLLRRTVLGFTKANLSYFATKTLAQSLAELLTISPAPTPPLNHYGTTDVDVPLGSTWINAPRNNTFEGQRRQSLRYWWVEQQLAPAANITERMILFWHNHLPVDSGFIDTDPRRGYTYYLLLRNNALGNFKSLVRNMSIDTAMLTYLDGRNNTKTAPNENYARELQELFTVGKDLPNTYTEADVQAAARVLTGWKINSTTNTSYFDNTQHDATNKVFSAFYNNTTIAGRSGANAGADELNDLINMVFGTQEVAKFMVRKLYRYFVYYKIDANTETTIINPLADLFRSSNYEILPVLQALLGSQHFFDTMQKGCVIKNPIEYVVGCVKAFELPLLNANVQTQYASLGSVMNRQNEQLMAAGTPPNVAGWSAYYQAPSYHEIWINADTLRKRKELIDRLFSNGFGGVKADTLAFTNKLPNPQDPNLLIDDVLELLHNLPADAALKTALKNILLSGQATDYYWTSAWNNYAASPTNTAYANIVRTRLISFYTAVLNIAEAHLL